MNKAQGGFAVITLIVLGTVLGCSTPDDGRGDPGKVVDREASHWTTTSGTGKSRTTVWHHDYDLTIRRPDGSTYELDVTEDGYDHCYRGSGYPKCISR